MNKEPQGNNLDGDGNAVTGQTSVDREHALFDFEITKHKNSEDVRNLVMYSKRGSYKLVMKRLEDIVRIISIREQQIKDRFGDFSAAEDSELRKLKFTKAIYVNLFLLKSKGRVDVDELREVLLKEREKYEVEVDIAQHNYDFNDALLEVFKDLDLF